MSNRRKFNTPVSLDNAYIENLVGMAINNMRDAKNIKGDYVYNYHNKSKVLEFIDKFYNIKIITDSNSPKLNNKGGLTTCRTTLKSSDGFNEIYKRSANRYKSLGNNNYSFEAKERLTHVLLKAVENLLR